MSRKTLEIGAAYIRVSTDDQTELSPDAQLREIQKTAKADGYIIPAEFVFVEKRGISGRRAENRPEFQRMIATAKSQKPAPFSRLYLWKFSRFARNQEESTFYKGILRKKCGVEIKSVSEPIMEGMFGRLIETIIEWFDEYYSYNLSGEVLRGMTEKALRNGYQSAPCLGYSAVGDGQPFTINEPQYQIVEYIFRAYHSGADMTRIARSCNDRGWRTQRGNPFERRSISRILQNHFYEGVVEWNGHSFQGTHETRPSVTDIFDDVQERIRREYRPLRRRDTSSCTHWVSGLLYCSICGATLSYNRSNDPKKHPPTFQCWKYAKGYHPGSCAITARRAEAAILPSMEDILKTGSVTYEYVPHTDAVQTSEADLIREALARLKIKERRIREAYENEIDTLEEFRQNKARLQEERQELERQAAALAAAVSAAPAPDDSQVLSAIRDAYAILSDPSVSYELKGTAARSVIKKIIYNRSEDTFTFTYYFSS